VHAAHWAETSDPLPITLTCPTGLSDYTHNPLIGICRTIFFHLPMISTKPCEQEAISAN